MSSAKVEDSMSSISTIRAVLLGCLVVAGFLNAGRPRLAAAQDSLATRSEETSAAKLEFPSVWVNSDPVSLESLRGKGVFLYFYEESCPGCKSKWPGMIETANKYEDEPIVFIAVNSGTSKAQVEQYAQSVQLPWPVIVDTDRSFERKCEVGEISLQNTMQSCYVTAGGELERGDWSDMDGTVRRALAGAKWNVDPAQIPSELKPLWRNLEFSHFADSRPALAKALGSRKPDIKKAAQALSDSVDERIERDLAAADKSKDEGHRLAAYERYGALVEKFPGYPAAAPGVSARRELAKDPALKKEMTTLKQFEKQRDLANSPKAAVRDKAIAAIQRIIDDQPDSEAARLGRELLEKK
jgi:thiol-disulfide isomerase/thioredoxin